MQIKYDKYLINLATIHDADILFKWWNDGKVMEHAGFINGLNISINKVIERLKNNKDNQIHIINYDGKAIGELNYSLNNNIARIGIKIADEEYQNKGHGTIILSLFIDTLFNHYHCDKIILDTNKNNLCAQYFYKKLGFNKVRINLDSWTDQVGCKQSSIDYELTKNNWNKLLVSYDIIN